MTTDLRFTGETRCLVAEALAEHRDVTTNVRTVACTCGEWSMPFDHLGITEIAAEFRLHKAGTVLAALADAGLLILAGTEVREDLTIEIGTGDGWKRSAYIATDVAPEPAYVGDIDAYMRGIVKPKRKLRRTVHTGPWMPR